MIDKELIQKFVSGKCSKAEEGVVLDFLEKNPDFLEQYLEWRPGDAVQPPPIDDRISQKMLDAINHTLAQQKRKRQLIGYGLAAVMAGLIIWLSLFLTMVNRVEPGPGLMVYHREPLHFFRNESSIPQHISLPDQTKVTLFPQSSIDFSGHYGRQERRITLSGEADFSVHKDANHPFIVTTRQITTTALGTRFKVKMKANHVLVQLFEGKVKVQDLNALTDSTHVLLPNQQIDFNVTENTFVLNDMYSIKKNAPLAEAIKPVSIPNQGLSFNNVPFQKVLDEIAKKYNIQIEYAPEDIRDVFVIASLDVNEPVEVLLRNLTQINNLTLTPLSKHRFLISK